MKQLIPGQLMSDHSEVVRYDTPGMPLYIQTGRLSRYPQMRAQCHWHEDLEMILILEGEMKYFVNGETLLLRESEGILVNSRRMHYGFSDSGKDCFFLCVLFHPTLLTSCETLKERYVVPLLDSRHFSCLHLSGDGDGKILANLRSFLDLKSAAAPGCELHAMSCLYAIWGEVAARQDVTAISPENQSPDLLSLQNMVSYIHTHFREAITLTEIAKAGNVCKSKCCALFRKQTGQTPFSFLNSYRLRLSANLLESTALPITQIALDCGFNHLSYFSKQFSLGYGCTPAQYRRSRPTKTP